ncbi:hypothetical protein Bca52824_068667 [Brassica carinata]|uniref:SKP1-like protein n=1 Tax=Brassica carinata TaxID=52824 RepID=A0A8X7Q459_BRACI|nr:hypothetical protein Bca52824_068667 [Brassica carinata]
MSTANKITLTSSDGESFKTDEPVAREFQIVANMIEDDCTSGSIPLANMASKALGASIEYSKEHVEADAVENNEEAADEHKRAEDFLANLDKLFDLISAAYHLNCEPPLDFITCPKLPDDIKDLPTEGIFKIENDFWEEEEAEVRKENDCAFK